MCKAIRQLYIEQDNDIIFITQLFTKTSDRQGEDYGSTGKK